MAKQKSHSTLINDYLKSSDYKNIEIMLSYYKKLSSLSKTLEEIFDKVMYRIEGERVLELHFRRLTKESIDEARKKITVNSLKNKSTFFDIWEFIHNIVAGIH